MIRIINEIDLYFLTMFNLLRGNLYFVVSFSRFVSIFACHSNGYCTSFFKFSLLENFGFVECIFVEIVEKTINIIACYRRWSLRLPATSLNHWYTRVFLRNYGPGPSNPTTFLVLCSPVTTSLK